MFDLFSEIISTIKRNKMRTFLTGFSVAWGIFMLIVLLGSGNGLRNGFSLNWGNRLVNSVQLWAGGRTTIPHAGFQKGREITFDDADAVLTQESYPKDIENVTREFWVRSQNIVYGKEYVTPSIQGVDPSYIKINQYKIIDGRFINDLDNSENRKVVVLSKRAVEILFKGKKAVGENVNVGGLMYTVVGVYHDEDQDDALTAYIPFTTGQMVYNRQNYIGSMLFALNNITTEEESKQFEKDYRAILAQKHQYAKEDEGPIGMWNNVENYLQLNGIMNYINIAVWIIGIFTLISGIVGVSNIMLITVRERTREFGIRKSLGASPWSILKLVIIESIFITTVFGYIGLVCGVGLTELLSNVFQASGGSRDSMNVFVNPTIDLGIAIQATVLLIISGTLAGFFPALKAVKLKTIDALNNK